MSISDAIKNEIRRKAGLGLSLTNSTPEKDAIYKSYQTEKTSTEVIKETLAEITRKAKAGIKLTDPNEWEGKTDIYRSVSSGSSSSSSTPKKQTMTQPTQPTTNNFPSFPTNWFETINRAVEENKQNQQEKEGIERTDRNTPISNSSNDQLVKIGVFLAIGIFIVKLVK